MISIAIPSFNRFQMVIECFEQVLHDSRVSEVVVVDDDSDDNSFLKLCNYFQYESKVKIYCNKTNLDCYANKKRAVELASNKWVMLIDSDNVIGVDYLDTIFDYSWDEKIILAPTKPYPSLDYTALNDVTLTKENVAQYMDTPYIDAALNTFNFFINRNEYLKVWDGSINPHTSDSIYFNYCWLKAGNAIHFTKGLQYFHRVHGQSHYVTQNKYTPQGFHENIIQQLKQLQ